MSLLSVEGLQKSFGGVVAASKVSFALDGGTLLAIIGPNGAGKSTIFNMVGGQLRPDGGHITLAGNDITGLAPRRIWHLGRGPHLSDRPDLSVDARDRECADGAH